MMYPLRILALSALAFALTTFSTAPLVHAQQTADDAGFLRVMNASADAPAVDVWLDGHAWARNLGFTMFTGHKVVPAGSHHIAIVPAGQDVNQALVNSTMDVADDQAYTVFAIGKHPDIRAIVLTDEASPSSPVQTDAYLRVVHAVPDAPSVDVLRPNEQGVFNVPAVVEDVEYGTGSGYQNVNAGPAALRLEAVNTNTDLATISDADFAQDGVYTLVLVPDQGGSRIQPVWLWDKIGSAIGGSQ